MSSPDDAPAPRRGRRRARTRRRQRLARIAGSTVLALSMLLGLTGIYYYRHLSGNLTVLDIDDQLIGDQPDKVEVEGPQQPLNILVMGSDSRDCAGCNVDNLTGGGQRSDTTIFLHLSADRTRAYGVSIPRDSMVDRPACKGANGTVYSAADYQMWNAAFSLGGPACTIQQFQSLTGIRLDHFVVVNFAGFRGMVDAIGGVQVCIPETIDDRRHGIYLPAGTRKLQGQQALNYVRERYAVSGGSDIGRMKRQQAFVASMAHAVLSAGTLANPFKVTGFLEAATSSLTVDRGLSNLAKIATLGYDFHGIGLDDVRFITIPNTVDPANPNHLVWTDEAARVWTKLRNDEPLTKQLSTDVISAANVPNGSKKGRTDHSEATQTALRDAGLCA